MVELADRATSREPVAKIRLAVSKLLTMTAAAEKVAAVNHHSTVITTGDDNFNEMSEWNLLHAYNVND